FVEMDDDLGVGHGGKRVATGDQLFAQGAVVVDFAVEDQPHRAVLVGHGLTPARHVDDAEARVRKSRRTDVEDLAVIRSAVRERRRHPREDFGRRRLTVELQDSAESAHSSQNFPNWLSKYMRCQASKLSRIHNRSVAREPPDARVRGSRMRSSGSRANQRNAALPGSTSSSLANW